MSNVASLNGVEGKYLDDYNQEKFQGLVDNEVLTEGKIDMWAECWENAGSTIVWKCPDCERFYFNAKQLYLRDLDLSGLNFSGRDMMESSFENVDLTRTNLEESWLKDSMLKDVNFANANLRGSTLDDSDIENVNFTGADLEEAELMGFVIAKNITFDNAKMDRASFVKSHIIHSSFKNASLIEANFKRSDIWDSDFENVNCSKADFTYANLVNISVKGVNIADADFTDVKDLPEEWKQAIGWHSEEQQNIRRIKEMLREEGLR